MIVIAIIALATASPARSDPVTFTVRPDQRFQTIDHFGASDAWTTKIFKNWSVEARDHVADLLFSTDHGIGLSQWRFCLGAGVGPERFRGSSRAQECFETAPGVYDFTKASAERAMLAAAKVRGVSKFVAFSYSPPPRMTLNGFTNPDPGPATINLKPGMEGDYAKYLADVVEHFARDPDESERVEFDRLSPINEPQWEWDKASQEDTRASNDDIKRIARPLARLLHDRRLKTKLLLVESGNIPDMYEPDTGMTRKYKADFGNYINAFAGDSSIAPLLGDVLGYHAYWSDDPPALAAHRQRLLAKAKAHADLNLWMTEYCIMNHGRDLTMSSALQLARVMHADLSVANAAGWAWWLAVSQGDYKDGLLYTTWHRPGDAERVIIPKMFWAFGNFSRFVRPGMVRVAIDGPPEITHVPATMPAAAPASTRASTRPAARTGNAKMIPAYERLNELVASAYIDPQTGRQVVVLINSGKAEAVVDIKHGPGKAASGRTVYLTSDAPGDDLLPLPLTHADDKVMLPARSIATVVDD